MFLDHALEYAVVLRTRSHLKQVGNCAVEVLLERTIGVDYIRNTAAHSRSKVAPGRAENRHFAARHVLAAVIADTFHDGRRRRVTDCESLARKTVWYREPLERALPIDSDSSSGSGRIVQCVTAIRTIPRPCRNPSTSRNGCRSTVYSITKPPTGPTTPSCREYRDITRP